MRYQWCRRAGVCLNFPRINKSDTRFISGTMERPISPNTYLQYRFYAIPNSNFEVAKLIKCMSFGERVNIHISSDGMRMTVEEAKCVQVTIFFRAEMFQVFHLRNNEEISLKISLKEMLECLKKMIPEGGSKTMSKNTITSLADPLIPVSGTKIRFFIGDDETIFKITLIEDAMKTVFRMKVEEYEDLIDFELSEVVVKILMRAHEVWDYFKTLEEVSPEIIGFKVTPRESLAICAECNEGSIEVVIPITADPVESFDCVETTKAMFKMSHIRHAIKIMNISTKCAFKLDSRGVLCFDFLIDGSGSDNFVHFYSVPQTVDEQESAFDY